MPQLLGWPGFVDRPWTTPAGVFSWGCSKTFRRREFLSTGGVLSTSHAEARRRGGSRKRNGHKKAQRTQEISFLRLLCLFPASQTLFPPCPPVQSSYLRLSKNEEASSAQDRPARGRTCFTPRGRVVGRSARAVESTWLLLEMGCRATQPRLDGLGARLAYRPVDFSNDSWPPENSSAIDGERLGEGRSLARTLCVGTRGRGERPRVVYDPSSSAYEARH
jgi:hypothetical protein